MEANLSPRTLVACALGMAVTVYAATWGALALVGPNGLIVAKASPPAIMDLSNLPPAEVVPEPPAVAASDPPVPEPVPAPVPAPPPIVVGISGLPGEQGALVGQMQQALVKKGYRVGKPDHFDDDTVSALQAFQDDKALTVQPACDQQCWNALGLSDPK